MFVKDYMDGFLVEYDHVHTNATVLKWINLLESGIDIVETYTVKYYVRALNTFQYDLPSGVDIEDIKAVYANGIKYKKKDSRAYKENRSYWYEDGKLCIYPACTEADLSYVSGAGEITFATDSITTTGDDFAFSVGDTILVSGATTVANNIHATIIGVAAKVSTFAASTFTAGADVAAVTIARPKIKVVYENKPTAKLLANIATDTLNLPDKWLEAYDYFLMSKIAYLAKDYKDQQNHAAMFDQKVKEYEDWLENHRPQSPESDIVASEEAYYGSDSLDFDTET